MQVDTHRRQLPAKQNSSQSGLARARLWLGISCVGATTLLCAFFLLIDLPNSIFRSEVDWSVQDLSELAMLFVAWTAFLIPFDLYGGFLLPGVFHRPEFQTKLKTWLKAIGLQGVLFVSTALAFLWVGRRFGVAGAVVLLVSLQILYLIIQHHLMRLLDGRLSPLPPQVRSVVESRLSEWGYSGAHLLVTEHEDHGFTGGICGLPGKETVVVPAEWIRRLPGVELAALVARRIEACRSYGRLQGLTVAVGWNVVGWLLAASLPGAGVRSVAELATTCFGFTQWGFLGLLLLPTLSRRSAYSIDNRVRRRGIPEEIFKQALARVQEMQDEATDRSKIVETIFYPVPSLQNRFDETSPSSGPGAWNAARNMLFLSWAGMGFLSRAVHCNCGRPELWVLLPTD